MSAPSYMDPIAPLIEGDGVEVVGSPKLVEDQQGKAKSAAAFPGCLGYKIPVEVIRGSREKTLPSGEVIDLVETKTINVTVWGKSAPSVSVGAYVRFEQLMVGAVDSSLFYQALGVASVSAV